MCEQLFLIEIVRKGTCFSTSNERKCTNLFHILVTDKPSKNVSHLILLISLEIA